MPLPVWFFVLVPRGGGNVEVRSGMSREQAVPKVNRIVIKVSKVGVTLPIPSNDIARGQAAQGRHLDGKAAREQDCLDKPCGPGFPVCRGRPGCKGKPAPLLVWLAPDAAGD